MIRKRMKVPEKQLPENSIAKIWTALDLDSNGLIDVGEVQRSGCSKTHLMLHLAARIHF